MYTQIVLVAVDTIIHYDKSSQFRIEVDEHFIIGLTHSRDLRTGGGGCRMRLGPSPPKML